MTQELNLSSIFKEVTKVLAANRQELNDVDEYNHNHGSNMVHTFDLIQKAVASKEDQPISDQLDYASRVLSEKSDSGSAKLYAEGLSRASQQFVGKNLNPATAGTLINAMMGVEPTEDRGGGDLLSSLLGSLTQGQAKEEPQAPAPTQPNDLLGSLIGSMGNQQQSAPAPEQPDDLLSSLLGGLGTQQQSAPAPEQPNDLLSSLLGGLGTQQQAAPEQEQPSDLLGSLLGGLGNQQQSQPESSDLLGSLLGGLTGSGSSQSSSGGGASDLISSLLGGQSSDSQSSGLDGKDLLSLGLAYFAAKQSGQSNLGAIMQALGSASPFGKSQDRQQSGALVINTILNMLGSR